MTKQQKIAAIALTTAPLLVLTFGWFLDGLSLAWVTRQDHSGTGARFTALAAMIVLVVVLCVVLDPIIGEQRDAKSPH